MFQRGSDELLSQTTVSVMAPSAPHADNNNQENAKKVSFLLLFGVCKLSMEKYGNGLETSIIDEIKFLFAFGSG